MPALPLQEIRRTEAQPPPKLYKGADALVHDGKGRWQRRGGKQLALLHARAERIHEAAAALRTLREHTFKDQLLKAGETVRRHARSPLPAASLDHALAALCEGAWRAMHLRPFPVQIMGALVLENSQLAEMATGEGKTLTIALAAAMAGWRRAPCHVITANDYLVRRDATSLTPFYELCGLNAGYVTGGMEPEERRIHYAKDITYTTSREAVADFLRDRIRLGQVAGGERRLLRELLTPGSGGSRDLVTRGMFTAIVDEADHVLVDEAVTPLIISRPARNLEMETAIRRAVTIAQTFEKGRDYTIQRVFKDIDLRASGREKLREAGEGWQGIWRSESRREELITTALKAREFYQPGKQYIVSEEGKIVIVDEFTGRVMPDRSWRQGLHQAVEAAEKLAITPPTETLARLSFQQYFRLYKKLSGVTGTAKESASELWRIYRLAVVPVPTNRPCLRDVQPARIFSTEDEKWADIVQCVTDLHRKGIPLLVGTRSVEASEHIASLLEHETIEAQLLNAKHHESEAHIVSGAGEYRKVTIATNMAGRGTDIRLGASVEAVGGLHVLATEMHESGRVDRQLFGRCARQGEPGGAVQFMSLDDELAKRFLPVALRKAAIWWLQRKGPGSRPVALACMRLAQKRSERFSFRSRNNVLKQDDRIDESLAFAPGPGQ